MNEDFLQYVWRFQRFTNSDLVTTAGEAIKVLKPGMHNRDAGPDFLDARLRIGDTLWAGNVEVHISASDWFKHNHQRDAAYDNVVLHVVYTANVEVKNGKGETIPTLCLRDRFDYQTWRYFKSWLRADSFIPCENMLPKVPEIIKHSAIQAAAIERLNEKSAQCFDHLNETRGDIEESLYRLLMRAFGFKVNAMPFEQLARITPFALLRKVWDNSTDLEALLLGQAGFLQEAQASDAYVAELTECYRFLAHKYTLEPMPTQSWKLFRLRPSNFPQVRIAQLAAFYHKNRSLAQKILEIEDYNHVRQCFDTTPAHDFWDTHYTLTSSSPLAVKHLGTTAIDLLLINAVVPFLFASGKFNKDEEVCSRAVFFMEQLPAEQNEVMRRFKSLGMNGRTAFDSQGLLQLKKFYCDQRKCLTCKAGTHILDNYEKNL